MSSTKSCWRKRKAEEKIKQHIYLVLKVFYKVKPVGLDFNAVLLWNVKKKKGLHLKYTTIFSDCLVKNSFYQANCC